MMNELTLDDIYSLRNDGKYYQVINEKGIKTNVVKLKKWSKDRKVSIGLIDYMDKDLFDKYDRRILEVDFLFEQVTDENLIEEFESKSEEYSTNLFLAKAKEFIDICDMLGYGKKKI